jgi:GNAT superfamily N-acetyltransferase
VTAKKRILKFRPARLDEAAAIADLGTAAAIHLTEQHGEGPWTRNVSEKGMLYAMRNGTVYVARSGNRLVGTLTLASKKPWAIDRSYFSEVKQPLYLTNMAVWPAEQRCGIGRFCIEAAVNIAAGWPADAIFLDSYDAKAGAGDFYAKCGFREVGRVIYRTCPLIYFERLL